MSERVTQGRLPQPVRKKLGKLQQCMEPSAEVTSP